jgi:hypothetical protein
MALRVLSVKASGHFFRHDKWILDAKSRNLGEALSWARHDTAAAYQTGGLKNRRISWKRLGRETAASPIVMFIFQFNQRLLSIKIAWTAGSKWLMIMLVLGGFLGFPQTMAAKSLEIDLWFAPKYPDQIVPRSRTGLSCRNRALNSHQTLE